MRPTLLAPFACSFLLLACSSSTSAPATVDDAGEDTGEEAAIPEPTTPADPAITCPLTIPADALASQRASCTFAAGATTDASLGVSSDLGKKLPIRHVIVAMKENRGFDHLFFKLHDLQPAVEAVPDTYVNPDTAGNPVKPMHATTTCIHKDPAHQWDPMHNQVDGGKMDGFVKSAAATTGTDGLFAISYYDQTDLPFYYWLASTWALDDRHFASIRSGTYPDRLFMMLGTNDGVKQTALDYPDPSTPTIFQRLEAAGYSWRVYSDGVPLSGSLNWDHSSRGVHTFAEFLKDVDQGTLPNVAFVDGIEDTEDEHPTGDVQRGEAWTRNVYQHVVASPQWERLAMIWTYDEAGGFFDHVPPPDKACVARPGNPKDEPYFELGVRIPLAVISPWAKPHYVSHVVQEHTSITRFVETLFGLGALTARDANADALLDMFDFSSCTPPMKTPPTAPAAGTGGCK
jgi:phospholipase C